MAMLSRDASVRGGWLPAKAGQGSDGHAALTVRPSPAQAKSVKLILKIEPA
jgi:hypothetical protein